MIKKKNETEEERFLSPPMRHNQTKECNLKEPPYAMNYSLKLSVVQNNHFIINQSNS